MMLSRRDAQFCEITLFVEQCWGVWGLGICFSAYSWELVVGLGPWVFGVQWQAR